MQLLLSWICFVYVVRGVQSLASDANNWKANLYKDALNRLEKDLTMRDTLRLPDLDVPEKSRYVKNENDINDFNMFKQRYLNKKMNYDLTNKKIADYTKLLSKTGVKKIDLTAKQLGAHLLVREDMTKTVRRVTDDFIIQTTKYFNMILGKKVENILDKEMFTLDLIETYNNALFYAESKLLDNIKQKVSNISPSQIYAAEETIKRQNLQYKKMEIEFVCTYLDICRPFPSFSDYIVTFIDEIFNLENDQITNLLDKFKTSLLNETRYFNEFMGDIITEVGVRFNSTEGNIFKIKEMLSYLRTVLYKKHRFLHTKDVKKQEEKKASRILLDIIDKTFLEFQDERLEFEFNSLIKAINIWAVDMSKDIGLILNSFITNKMKMIQYNWSDDTKKEVKTLLEILLQREPNDKTCAEYLLTKGSNFIRGRDFIDVVQTFI